MRSRRRDCLLLRNHRAGLLRTSTRVSSISWMISRIIFSGSSALSHSAFRLEFTMSEILEKFPCLSLGFPHSPARPSQRSRAQPSRERYHLPPVSGYTARSHSLLLADHGNHSHPLMSNLLIAATQCPDIHVKNHSYRARCGPSVGALDRRCNRNDVAAVDPGLKTTSATDK